MSHASPTFDRTTFVRSNVVVHLTGAALGAASGLAVRPQDVLLNLPLVIGAPVSLGLFLFWLARRHTRLFGSGRRKPLRTLLGTAGRLLVILVGAALGGLFVAHQLTASSAGLVGAALTGAVLSALATRRLWQTPLRLLKDPKVGEVWWADVPFEESQATGKDRPCLVLRTTPRACVVLMFTSKDHPGDDRYLPVPPSVWRSPRRSFLRTDRRIRVEREAFRRLEGVAPDVLMNQLRP